jgi:hypothetical protein
MQQVTDSVLTLRTHSYREVLYQQVSRYGSAATLELDGGEGRRYNETFQFEGHQWLLVDKQEGVYAGGKAEYTGVRTFEVYADYQKGMLY